MVATVRNWSSVELASTVSCRVLTRAPDRPSTCEVVAWLLVATAVAPAPKPMLVLSELADEKTASCNASMSTVVVPITCDC